MDHDDGISNPSKNRPFEDVLATRLKRRSVLAPPLPWPRRPATVPATECGPMTLDLVPLAGSFAREVRGVSLHDPLDGVLGSALREAFSQHPVLVFRRQALGEDELVAFASALGTPERYVERSWWSSRPEVSIVSNMRNGTGELIGGLSSRELEWHTDQSYNAEPVTGCFLYAQVVPEAGGRTKNGM